MPGIDTQLPITLPLWIAASIPILILLALLVWRRWSTSAAAPVAVAAAVAIGLTLFRMPLPTLAVAAGKGVWDAIFILYVIWPSLILYNVANEAGAFAAIQKGVRKLMPDRLLVVLAFAWVLSSFIQGIAGFGTPLAVTTPLLIGLGMKPMYAVLLPLIGPAWGNVFGSLGVPWLATLAVVDLPSPDTAVLYAAILLWIPNLMAGLAIAWMYGRWWALRRAWPAILLISLLHGGLQLLLVPILPSLGNFLATAAALGATLGLARWGLYRQLDEDEPDRMFTPEARTTFQLRREQTAAAERTETVEEKAKVPGDAEIAAPPAKAPEEPSLPLALAFAPYAVLAVLAIVALMVPPVRDLLEQLQVGLPFPETATGYGIEREAEASYAAFTPLTHPGTILLLSAAVGYFLYRARDLYPPGLTPRRIIGQAATAALPATTAITALLLISKVMDHSGEITVLALGISAVAPKLAFVGASSFIGILGTLLTSSSTASNVLFAPLQETTAVAEGIAKELVVAAQATGGAVGGAMAPGDVLLGATVAGIPDKLGAILGRAIPWALVTGLLVAGATLLLFLVS
jgi:lactate permease